MRRQSHVILAGMPVDHTCAESVLNKPGLSRNMNSLRTGKV